MLNIEFVFYRDMDEPVNFQIRRIRLQDNFHELIKFHAVLSRSDESHPHSHLILTNFRVTMVHDLLAFIFFLSF